MGNRSAAVTVEARTASPNETPQVTKLGPVFKKVPLNLRVPRNLRERLEEDVLPLWKLIATEKGEDAELIDLSYVCVRILEGESIGELAQFGLEEFPKTREGVAALRAEVQQRIRTERETQ